MDPPDLNQVTSLQRMFWGCQAFNNSILSESQLIKRVVEYDRLLPGGTSLNFGLLVIPFQYPG